MKTLMNEYSTTTQAQVQILASDGKTFYTGVMPHQVTLSVNINAEQRG